MLVPCRNTTYVKVVRYERCNCPSDTVFIDNKRPFGPKPFLTATLEIYWTYPARAVVRKRHAPNVPFTTALIQQFVANRLKDSHFRNVTIDPLVSNASIFLFAIDDISISSKRRGSVWNLPVAVLPRLYACWRVTFKHRRFEFLYRRDVEAAN